MNDSHSQQQYSIRGHGSKYDRRMEAVIAALLGARTEQEAALEAGISRKTLYRWKKLPEFSAALLARKQELLNSASARYVSAGPAAASTVLKIMVDPNVPASARLRAACQVHAVCEKSVEREARSVQAAQLEREKYLAEAEERSRSSQGEVLRLMDEDGDKYLALVRRVYAEGRLTSQEYSDLRRCNARFLSIWRRLDIPFSCLRPDNVSFRILDEEAAEQRADIHSCDIAQDCFPPTVTSGCDVPVSTDSAVS